MKLEIEYPLAFKAIPPRGQYPRTFFAMDRVQVDIPEYAGTDMPVALEVGVTDDAGGRWRTRYRSLDGNLYVAAKQPLIEGGLCRYRFSASESAVFSPVFQNHHHAAAVNALSTIVRKHTYVQAKDLLYPPEVYRSHYSRGEAVELPMLGAMRFTEAEEGAVERARADFARRVSDVVSVDGKFSIRRSEPFYLARADGQDGPSVTVVTDHLPHDFEEHPEYMVPAVACFPIDEPDRAMDYAAEMWRVVNGLDDDPAVAPARSQVKLVDPSCLRFDGDRYSVIKAGARMQRQFVMGQSRSADVAGFLRETGIETLVAYKNLEAALEGGFGDADADAVASAAKDCLAVEQADRFLRDDPAALVEMALGRWERREARQSLGLFF